MSAATLVLESRSSVGIYKIENFVPRAIPRRARKLHQGIIFPNSSTWRGALRALVRRSSPVPRDVTRRARCRRSRRATGNCNRQQSQCSCGLQRWCAPVRSAADASRAADRAARRRTRDAARHRPDFTVPAAFRATGMSFPGNAPEANETVFSPPRRSTPVLGLSSPVTHIAALHHHGIRQCAHS